MEESPEWAHSDTRIIIKIEASCSKAMRELTLNSRYFIGSQIIKNGNLGKIYFYQETFRRTKDFESNKGFWNEKINRKAILKCY